jgi:hypothetical protein
VRKSPEMDQPKRFKLRWIAIPAVLFFTFFVWTTDKVTWQGERTIYTVNCLNGSWDGNRCSGKLTAGPRFRYRALKGRREVLFWVLGTQEPSTKLTGCTIQDGRNWTCPVSVDAPKSLTLEISGGEAIHNPSMRTRPFHSTTKVGWWLLQLGINSEFVI